MIALYCVLGRIGESPQLVRGNLGVKGECCSVVGAVVGVAVCCIHGR